MTLNEYAYSLLNTVTPKLADDEQVDIRQVKTWIIDTRLTFLKNQLNQSRFIDPSITQTITKSNFTLQYDSQHNGVSLFKTVGTIPKILQMYQGPAILRIGPASPIAPSFRFSNDLKEIAYTGHGRFNTYGIFCYLEGDRLFFKTRNSLFIVEYNNNLSLTAVFSDPTELSKYSENGKPIYSDEHTEFPMNRDMKMYIEKEIITSKFGITEQAVPDEENDGRDNVDDVAAINAARRRRN
jgi:hypothetical protein